MVRLALKRYEAGLARGEAPPITDEVLVAMQIEGLSYGHELQFSDEVKR